MAEVFVEFDIVLRGPDGRRYGAQACGRARTDGLWEGWVEFPSLDGGAAARTSRETTQPNRDDLRYWATGLTAAYLDGALLRTLRPPRPVPGRNPTRPPAFEGPAERPATATAGEPHAVLNPFLVYAEGADILRNQLGALSRDQLRNIALAHGLAGDEVAELHGFTKPDLVALIMHAVEERTAGP
jgi:hypothetical protein